MPKKQSVKPSQAKPKASAKAKGKSDAKNTKKTTTEKNKTANANSANTTNTTNIANNANTSKNTNSNSNSNLIGISSSSNKYDLLLDDEPEIITNIETEDVDSESSDTYDNVDTKNTGTKTDTLVSDHDENHNENNNMSDDGFTTVVSKKNKNKVVKPNNANSNKNNTRSNNSNNNTNIKQNNSRSNAVSNSSKTANIRTAKIIEESDTSSDSDSNSDSDDSTISIDSDGSKDNKTVSDTKNNNTNTNTNTNTNNNAKPSSKYVYNMKTDDGSEQDHKQKSYTPVPKNVKESFGNSNNAHNAHNAQYGTQNKDKSDDLSLNTPWKVWIHANDSRLWNLESYHSGQKIETVGQMLSTLYDFESLNKKDYQYFIMRNEIAPIWEDINNKDGVITSIKINVGNRESCDIGSMSFKVICMLVLNESFVRNNMDINGVCYSIKNNSPHIKFWVKDRTRNSTFERELPISLLKQIESIVESNRKFSNFYKPSTRPVSVMTKNIEPDE